MKIIQSMNQQKSNTVRFSEKSNKLKGATSMILIFGIFRPLIYLIEYFMNIIILYFGSLLVMDKVVEIGIITTFSLYISQLFNLFAA